jgi:hypothetical protein
VATKTSHGQAQGPGEQGATLRQPWDTQGQPPAAPGALQKLWNPTAGGAAPAAVPPEEPAVDPDINKDIAVTPELGPWLVSITAYSGGRAPLQARQMVAELRGKYKLAAYVFTHGSDRRRQEQEWVKKRIEDQRAWLDKARQQYGEHEIQVLPIRVKRLLHVDEHCAVLVGGYRDEATARRALDEIRRLKPELIEPAQRPFLLETQYYGMDDPTTQKIRKGDGEHGGDHVFVNPFVKALVVPNPTAKHERPPVQDTQDLAVLRRLNSGVPYSLLECPNRYTLAIKHFQTPIELQTRGKSTAAGFLSALHLGKAEPKDYAADNAVNLAEALRKSGLEAYVLHTKFASLVTVGGYDSPDDPRLRAMQQTLLTNLSALQAQIQLLPEPVPILIPR